MSTGQGIVGNNMFAYCLNNPVNFSDHKGNIAIADDALCLLLALITAVSAVIIAYYNITPASSRSLDGLLNTINAAFASIGTVSMGIGVLTISLTELASIYRSLAKTDAKSKEKIRREKERFDYWVASYVDFGNGFGTYIPTMPLSYSLAISYVRAGGSVFADSKGNAFKLARAVPESDAYLFSS